MKRYSYQQFNSTLVMRSHSKGIAAIQAVMDVRVYIWAYMNELEECKGYGF
jgi:hypothetical protein